MSRHASYDEDLLRQVEALSESLGWSEVVELARELFASYQTEGYLQWRDRRALIRLRTRLEDEIKKRNRRL